MRDALTVGPSRGVTVPAVAGTRDEIARAAALVLDSSPTLLRHSSGTTVLAAGPAVVRVAEPHRSAIDVARLVELASLLAARGVPTPEPLAWVVAGHLELSVWRRYRTDAAPVWAHLGAWLGTLHDLPLATLGTLPPFAENLDRGRARIARYDQELPGLLARWEALAVPLTSAGHTVVHGDMNLSNVLWGDIVSVCDLEAVCAGPPEWDLAKLYETVLPAHGQAAFKQVLTGYPHPVRDDVLAAAIATNHVKATTWQLAELDAGAPASSSRPELLVRLRAVLAR